MNTQLLEEMIFAQHSSLQSPLHVATLRIDWSHRDVQFVINIQSMDDKLEMLGLVAGVDALEAQLEYVLHRVALLSSLCDAAALSFLQQARQMMIDSECWSDDDIHQWQFHRLVDIIRRTPSDALAAVNLTLIDVDTERRTVAFG